MTALRGNPGKPEGEKIACRFMSVGERARARLTPRLLEALASVSESRSRGVPEVAPAPGARQPALVG